MDLITLRSLIILFFLLPLHAIALPYNLHKDQVILRQPSATIHITATPPATLRTAAPQRFINGLESLESLVSSVLTHHISRLDIPASIPDGAAVHLPAVIGSDPYHIVDSATASTDIAYAPRQPSKRKHARQLQLELKAQPNSAFSASYGPPSPHRVLASPFDHKRVYQGPDGLRVRIPIRIIRNEAASVILLSAYAVALYFFGRKTACIIAEERAMIRRERESVARFEGKLATVEFGGVPMGNLGCVRGRKWEILLGM